MTSFKAMFDRSTALALAKAYKDDNEEAWLLTGQGFSNGDLSRVHLMTIFRWKTRNRGKGRIAENTDLEISDALGLAVAARTQRSAIALFGNGPKVRKASNTREPANC
jgi:hypothetical protein